MRRKRTYREMPVRPHMKKKPIQKMKPNNNNKNGADDAIKSKDVEVGKADVVQLPLFPLLGLLGLITASSPRVI